MKSNAVGKSTLKAEVTNISNHGVWLLVSKKEYFLPFENYPWFKKAKVQDVLDIQLQHDFHLRWEALDVDLELEKMDRPKHLTAYLWLPVKDFEAPSVEQFYLGVHFIDQLVRRRIKTLVHCNVGFGRAPTLLTAYLTTHKGKSIKEAIAMMSHKRPGVSPNQLQISAIRKFVRSFNRSLIK